MTSAPCHGDMAAGGLTAAGPAVGEAAAADAATADTAAAGTFTTDLVIGVSPLNEPDARLASAVSRAGGLGVLDLGRGDRRAREALELMRRWAGGRPFGVRVAAGCRLSPAEAAAAGPGTVLLGAGAPWRIGELAGRHRVLAEVTCAREARAAVAAGAHGLVARGGESGGRVGDLSSFVLLQMLLADPCLEAVPVWACGGIGPCTAAAAVVGGAAGVVLDTQLALLAESGVPQDVAALLRSMDGSETVVADGFRGLRRRGAEDGDGDGDGGPLPVGQDGFLAARLAERWGDAGRTVRGIADAVRDAVRGEAVSALLPGSAMCRALGTRLAVAQGPMTRVSDGAAFAAAVAGEGALPFLALALAGPEQAGAMLAEAGRALAGRPWGVGVLGFAPEEVRRAQLEAVRRARPSHAIIAGGRPSQAAALERAGIAAFLHVPSPGLLRQYLEAGARRFVFEGSECGGHVGPRAAFPLWEAQLAVLEDFLDGPGAGGAGVEVFFAGGVHDERSAAMVAALAAPLTRRGAAVGLLMGTAYLFTREAVACGAVHPLFQRQVLSAERTVLLETAPGHASRCVGSPFADGYRAVRDRARARGATGRRLWEELERLNVGRLRIAAKGVDRGPDGALAHVGEDRQYRDGMFMAGQVAVLRSATTSVGALHRAVGPGAADFFAARAARLRLRLGAPAARPPAPAPLDVAVVGLACMFPQAPDLATFWANVLAGADAVTEVPPERWDSAVHHGAPGERTTASRWGGFLPPVPFDPLRYGIPPASLGSIEPVQLLALEAARRALEDAGYADRPFDRSRACVVFGAEAGSDLSHAQTLRAVLPSYLGAVPPELAEQLPALTEDSFPGMLANVISGRIANRLDLGGANYTVDAACASSLAAVDAACKELVSGAADLALCGGADLHNGINDYMLFSSVHALSPTGRSRAFDASADGIALGEGVACAVLKRLADAERDGDRVYCVIKGVGASSDGRSLGLTAPRPEGQRAALERAYRNARVSPARVGLVEAHGTGTAVGDRAELTVLGEVFTAAGAARGGCALGSVKSQIGHTKCAAGLAGLVKAAMALHTGVRPPTLHVTRPNAAWSPADSPFVFHTEARPWAAPPGERAAGLSAFGFGGTNFHVVLAGHDGGAPPACGVHVWPAELFLFRGADRAAALREAAELLRTARDGRAWRLRDLALVAARRCEAGRGPVRAALVAGSLEELAAGLGKAAAGEGDPAGGVHLAEGAAGGKVAFLFPGQGSQRPGMFGELFTAFPELHRLLEGGCADGAAYADALFPPAAFDEAGRAAQRERITDTRVAQPVLGIAGSAAYTLLTAAGVRPAMAAGHSYGELAALAAAGVFDAGTLLELSAARAAAVLDAAGAEPGAMAAVAAGAAEVERVLGGRAGGVVVANRNAPRQTVVSGPARAVEEAVRLLRGAGHGARRLPVACAFHSPLVAGAGARFAAALARCPVRAPEFPVWAGRTAAPYGTDPDAVRAELAAQIEAPVRFAELVEAVYAAGARVFVEAGPGAVLTGLVGEILGDRPHRAVPFEGRGGGLRGYLDSLARLAVAGVPVRTGWMFQGRDAVVAPPERPGWTVDGQLVRTADGGLLPGALAPARRIAPVAGGGGSGAADGARGDGDALVLEFLRSSREMVAAQRDVLLRHLGGTGAGEPPAVAVEPGAPRRAAPDGATPDGAAADPVAAEPITAEPVAAGPERPTREGALEAVAQIISERTGYPVDMVEPDLDLEADLSIDSIKRAEIAGELARRFGLGAEGPASLGDEELEQLAKARTATAVAEWLVERSEAAGGGTPHPVPAPTTAVPTAAAQRPAGTAGGALAPAAGTAAHQSAGAPPAAAAEGLPALPDPAAPAAGAHQGPNTFSATAPDRRQAVGAALPAAPSGATAPGTGTAVPPEPAAPPAPVRTAAPPGDASAHQNPEAPPATAPDRRQAAGRAAPAAEQTTGAALPAAPSGATAPAAGTAVRPGLGASSAPGRAAAPAAGASACRAPGGLPAAGAVSPSAPTRVAASAATSTARTARDRGTSVPPGDDPPAPVGAVPERCLVQPVALGGGRGPAGGLQGARFALVGGGDGLAAAVSRRLAGCGAHAAAFGEAQSPGEPVDGVLLLGPLARSGAAVLPGVFPVVRAALRCGPRWLLAARWADPLDVRTAGLRGLFRTVEREYPAVAARLVEFAEGADVAEGLVEELLADERVPVVLRTPRGRYGLAPAGAPLEAPTGAVPLGPESVVVVAGGGRGITARCAAALAGAARCRIELLGRTAPTGPPDPGGRDEREVRAALAARGGARSPAALRREAAGILARRGIRRTVERVERLGGRARYRAVDVRDADAVRRALKEIHAEHGRLDGLVHGAGIVEDRLIEEKSEESFQRVFDTKAGGASALLEGAAELPDPPAFAVLFGSVSAVLGNRGQADYAAANDALEALGARWAAHTGRRALTVHWGPWAPSGEHGGMVTPELARAYARRGLGLIDPAEGARALLRELAGGDGAPAVVYTAPGG